MSSRKTLFYQLCRAATGLAGQAGYRSQTRVYFRSERSVSVGSAFLLAGLGPFAIERLLASEPPIVVQDGRTYSA